MQAKKHLYTFSYDGVESDLCKLEAKCLFNAEERNKILFSDVAVTPADSAFLKKRLDIQLSSNSYDELIQSIQKQNIKVEGFKVEYLVMDGDATSYPDRLSKLKDIGYSIEGIPDYYHPTITYALCLFEDVWYFGQLHKNTYAWKKHKSKPHSYSISLGIHLAKALVNIATRGDKNIELLDACCGVGTIMLEACFAKYSIEGCDINWKICNDARENIAHFNYAATVQRSDLKDIDKTYDAAIVDLPYNLFTDATEADLAHLINAAAAISNRLVIVSCYDITELIAATGHKVTDYCVVGKSGKRKFARQIWVCEKPTTSALA